MDSELPEPSPPSFPYFRILAVFLFVLLPVLGFILGFSYHQKTVADALSRSGQNENPDSGNELLKDVGSLGSDIIVSGWQTRYAAYVRYKDTPLDYRPFGTDSGSLSVSQELVVLNLDTGERRVFEFTQNFIPPSMLGFLKGVPPDGGSHYRLRAEVLRWSPSGENVFWGKLSIYSGGDPPVANEVGYFRFDIPDSKIDNYALPGHGLFGAVNENTNAGKVLYESLGDGLSLYLYDLETKEDRLIVSYDRQTFDRYCGSIFEYVYHDSSFYGSCGRERGLRATWEQNGISFFDFVTGRKVELTVLE